VIEHNHPLISASDVAAVTDTLRSGFIAQGTMVKALEHAFVKFYGGGGACACSSGTAALFLTMRGLGIGRDDIVAVPSYSCSAILNSVYMTGATPRIVDVKLDDFTIDFEAVKKQAPDVRIVIAVHTYGAKADIIALKRTVNLVIEDCCHSLGGSQDNRLIGCEGNAAVFSFYATKIITCGHGGMIWDPKGKVAKWARDYRNFDCREIYKPRFNFHLTDIQAAMVKSQFARLEEIKKCRRKIADKYYNTLSNNIGLQFGLHDEGRMIYRFVLKLDSKAKRDTLKRYLNDQGVQATIPIERYELLHRYLGLNPADFPNAEILADTTLSLPLYPALSDQHVDHVCEKLRKAIEF